MLYALTHDPEKNFSLTFDNRFTINDNIKVVLFNNAQENWACEHAGDDFFFIAEKDSQYNITGNWKKVRNIFKFYTRQGDEFNPEEKGLDLITANLL